MNEEQQIIQIKEIVSEFENSVKEVTSVALNSPKGGDDEWYKLLEEYKQEPVTEVQKEAFYSYGMPVTKGAFPLELRKVYKCLRYEAIKKYNNKFGNIELESEAEWKWDNFTDRLRDFIDEEINIYIGKIKQVVDVSGIFANAFSGMNKYSHGLGESNLNTKTCNGCGAPRLDTDQYKDCYFCGTLLFETKETVTECESCGSPKFIEDQGKKCQFCGN